MSSITEQTPMLNRSGSAENLQPVDKDLVPDGAQRRGNSNSGAKWVFGGLGLLGAAGAGYGIEETATHSPISPTAIATAVLGGLVLLTAFVGWRFSTPKPPSDNGDLHDVKSTSHYFEAEIRPLQQEVEGIMQQLDLQELNGEHSIQAVDDSSIVRLAAKVKKIAVRLKQLKSDLSDERLRNGRLEDRVNVLSSEKDQAARELAALRQERQEMSAVKTDTRIPRLTSENTQLKEEIIGLRAKNKVQRDEISKKVDELEKLQDKVSKLEQQLQSRRRQSDVSSVGDISYEGTSQLDISEAEAPSPIPKSQPSEDTDN